MSEHWRNPRLIQLIGVIGTVIWLTHVGLTTEFDRSHPLFNYIFIVPLAGWIGIALICRRLERRGKD
jgi:hypothetical protein